VRSRPPAATASRPTVGLERDGSGFSLDTRSQRYAAVLEDVVIKSLFVEQKPGLDVSSAESVLAAL